jgi:hypothetical protein
MPNVQSEDIKQIKLYSDWTDSFDQDVVAHLANKIVDEIVENIHKSQLALHTYHNLSHFEVALLYRYPIYIGVNLFIEKLLRVNFVHHSGGKNDYPLTDQKVVYFNNSNQSVQAYYYDFLINYRLLNDLSYIISGSSKSELSYVEDLPTPQELLEQVKDDSFSLKKVLKTIFLAAEKMYIKIFKPKVVGEYSNWFREIFFFGHSIHFSSHKFADQNEKVNTVAREELKRICNHILIDRIPGIIDELDDQQIKQCAKRFGEWIDYVLPLSIIEGLMERFHYYQNMLKNWPVEQVHAFTGYYYNDNFKVFAILAKRIGAKFIGHAHGASNYVSSYKASNELLFLDYYTTYGISVVDSLLNNPDAAKVKLIPTGSTDFYAVRKWNKSSISSENCTLLYASGPLEDFMNILDTISPEKNLEHRMQVLAFLDQLLNKYPGLKIIYKPFSGTYINDPIKEHCSGYMEAGRIELTDTNPKEMYSLVDLVLWDSISTGFGECAVAGVPIIVFNSRYEYEQTSPRGKIVNDDLTDAGVQCFDGDSAMLSYERIVQNLAAYKKDTASAIQMFKDDLATPVSRREWHQHFKQGFRVVEDI